MYFEGSVKGLNEGAPLVFRGVKIGSVTRVQLVANTDDLSFRIPVFVEVEQKHFTLTGDQTLDLSPKEQLVLLVARGLRAQLIAQNLVTGQLIVELDFHPDKPAKLVAGDSKYLEIPTIRSSMDDLVDQIEKAPIEDILNKVLLAVDGIEKTVNSSEVKESLNSLEQTLKNLNKLIQNIDSRIEPLVSSVEETLKDYGKLARAVTEEGETLGVVADWLETEAHGVFIIRDDDGKEILLPDIDEVILKIDLEAAQMIVHLLEGLLG